MIVDLGIDIGKTGAIAFLTDDGQAYIQGFEEEASFAFAICKVVEYAMRVGTTVRATVERQQAMPTDGSHSAFELGKAYGITLGILDAMGVPYQVIGPSQWKAKVPGGSLVNADLSRAQKKSASRERARQLFPSLTPEFKRVKDDGKAEALLIALVGQKVWSVG